MTRRLTSRIAVLAAIGGLVVPVLIDLVVSDRKRVVGYLAADAFYYLAVARNIGSMGMATFDQAHATNGFHPLWQYLLAGWHLIAGGRDASQPLVMYGVVVIVLAMLAGALWWLGRAFEAARGSVSPFFALLPIGLFGLMVLPFWIACWDGLAERNPYEGSAPVWGTLYMAVNGMETAPLILSWAAIAWLVVARPVLSSTKWAVALGVALAACALSRLDHVFFPMFVGLALLIAAARARDGRAVRLVILAGVVAAIPLGAYAIWNEVAFGSVMPVSGGLKSTFPAPTPENMRALAEIVSEERPPWWLENGGRAAQNLYPMVVAAVFLYFTRPRRRILADPAARFDLVLRASAAAVLVLGTYNFVFVPWAAQGHWYYPLSTLFVSIAALRALSAWPRAERLAGSRAGAIGVTAAAAVAALLFFVIFHRHEDYHRHYADFIFDHAPALRRHFGSERPRVVEFDDGVVAYGTGYPSIPSAGYTLDPEGARAVHEGRLVDLAEERGHLHFTSSILEVERVEGSVRRRRPGARLTIPFRNGRFGIVKMERPPLPVNRRSP